MNAHTGRFDYENVITGDKLTFQQNGAWCVGADCSAPIGGATPMGVVMTSHEVGNAKEIEIACKGYNCTHVSQYIYYCTFLFVAHCICRHTT